MNIRHAMRFPIIADSGANYRTFKDPEFFETLIPASGKVLLGDGKTSLQIKGILSVEGVCYTLDLAESIYILFLHIQPPHHGLRSRFDDA
jgi:hypothetical protein